MKSAPTGWENVEGLFEDIYSRLDPSGYTNPPRVVQCRTVMELITWFKTFELCCRAARQ